MNIEAFISDITSAKTKAPLTECGQWNPSTTHKKIQLLATYLGDGRSAGLLWGRLLRRCGLRLRDVVGGQRLWHRLEHRPHGRRHGAVRAEHPELKIGADAAADSGPVQDALAAAQRATHSVSRFTCTKSFVRTIHPYLDLKGPFRSLLIAFALKTDTNMWLNTHNLGGRLNQHPRGLMKHTVALSSDIWKDKSFDIESTLNIKPCLHIGKDVGLYCYTKDKKSINLSYKNRVTLKN